MECGGWTGFFTKERSGLCGDGTALLDMLDRGGWRARLVFTSGGSGFCVQIDAVGVMPALITNPNAKW